MRDIVVRNLDGASERPHIVAAPSVCVAVGAGDEETDEGVDDESAGRVLVVDDEWDIADVVSIALRSNYDVEVAANGQDALKAVSEFRPDLVLLDVMLPDLNGFEVSRRLRDRADEVPILFLAAGRDR